MSQATSIEWTDVSWNPVHGCSKVSPGCAHCYAETLSRQYKQTPAPWTPANAERNVILKPHKLREPFSNAKAWRGLGAAAAGAGKTEGKLVFVNSRSDLFHEQIPAEYIARVFAVMGVASRHTFQVLTKRPERMRDMVRSVAFMTEVGTILRKHDTQEACGWPLPNVWLGVSIENRRFVHRADVLRDTPAAVRFISAEPLLGPLVHDVRGEWERIGGTEWGWPSEWSDDYDEGTPLDLDAIDWLIVGGESGPGHRRLDLQWTRDLIDACRASGTAPFVKQLGGARPGTKLEDLPEDLRVREYPAVQA